MNRTTLMGAVVAIAAVAIVAALFLLRRAPEPAITGPERAEEAREFIADAGEKGPESYADAFTRAEEYRRQGQLADAQLLYFYAARGGNADAEFALAEMNDPNHHAAGKSLLAEPDAYQAFKWYSAALEHGSREAQQRLDALHEWATQAAERGDSEAERVLLQWSR
jgi:TPR repeat protein